MLSALFNTFGATEAQLTPSAIKRLRVTSLLSLLVIPCYAALDLLEISGGLRGVLLAIGLISFAGMSYAFTTRLANRLWIPEKYLDEDEIERKRRSMSLTCQLLLGVLAFLTGAAVVASQSSAGLTLNMNSVVFLLASLFFMAFSFQISLAAWMTKPLNNGAAEQVRADKIYKWVAMLVIVVCVGIGVLVGKFSGFH